MAEKQRAANIVSPRPGAGRGQPPRGSCSLAWVLIAHGPERARVERPAPRHARRAHGTMHTQRRRRPPRHVKVTSCVRRDRLDVSSAHDPKSLHNAPGHSGTCAWRRRGVPGPTAGTSGAGKRASAAHGTQALSARACTHPKALLTEHVPRTHSQRHTERTHNADVHTSAGVLCLCTALLLLQSTKLTICSFAEWKTLF